jgi:hypothetical protein
MKWGIVYYKAANGNVPGDAFLDAWRSRLRRRSSRCLRPCALLRPRSSVEGGKWEAMRGRMGGYYEIRVTGPGRVHYRLFCRLENGTRGELQERGFDGPQIVVINGLSKPNASLFTDAEYRKHVREPGDAYLARLPRPVAEDEDD